MSIANTPTYRYPRYWIKPRDVDSVSDIGSKEVPDMDGGATVEDTAPVSSASTIKVVATNGIGLCPLI